VTRRRALCVAKDYVAADAIKKVRGRARARIRVRIRGRVRDPNPSPSAHPNLK